MRPERYLITGGAGFIGSHLADALIARGCSVTVADNVSTGRIENITHLLGNPGFIFENVEVTDESAMKRLAKDADVIFHLAAVVGVDLIVKDPINVIETNIMGARSVLRAAMHSGSKVLMASTSEIYGKGERVPFAEDDDRVLGPTVNSRWSYSASKAVDEFLTLAYAEQHGLPVVIFRLFNTVGARQTGQYGMVVPRFVEKALAGETLAVFGDGRQTRSFCDVRDVIRALIALSESELALGQVFNVGGTEEISILELARLVLQIVDGAADAGMAEPAHGGNSPAAVSPLAPLSTDERIVFVPYEQAYKPGFEDMRRRVPDTRRIRDVIGWEPRITLEETLKSVMADLRIKVKAG